jgi:hypothetical protein
MIPLAQLRTPTVHLDLLTLPFSVFLTVTFNDCQSWFDGFVKGRCFWEFYGFSNRRRLSAVINYLIWAGQLITPQFRG